LTTASGTAAVGSRPLPLPSLLLPLSMLLKLMLS
jgi:hypothetical protein